MSRKNSGQPGGNRGQNICSLRAENILRHTAAERSAEPFAFRSLHENNENHEQPNDDLERKQKLIKSNIRDGQYRQTGEFVNDRETVLS